MGIFKGQTSNNKLGLYSDSTRDYIPCGDTCRKCGRGECSKQIGHSTGMSGHRSSSGDKNCGHSWDD